MRKTVRLKNSANAREGKISPPCIFPRAIFALIPISGQRHVQTRKYLEINLATLINKAASRYSVPLTFVYLISSNGKRGLTASQCKELSSLTARAPFLLDSR